MSFRDDIQDKIKIIMEDKGLTDLRLIIDGKQKTTVSSESIQSGHAIYVKCAKSERATHSKIIFGFFAKSDNEKVFMELPNYINSLATELGSKSFCGKKYPIEFCSDDIIMFCDMNSDELIVESGMYHIGREIVENGHEHAALFRNGEEAISTSGVATLRNDFMNYAFKTYVKQVYSNKSTILRRIRNHQPLYAITPTTFIPIFINVKRYFNPFNYLPTIENTSFMKDCKTFGRYFDENGISYYLMTHLEICKAFKLSQFVRFTPEIWVNIFGGLLHIDNFPNSSKRVFVSRETGRRINENTVQQMDPSDVMVVNSLELFITEKKSFLDFYGAYPLDNIQFADVVAIYGGAKL